jgi:prepilin-type N-terminal cleavage/methylation domain-containing protein
MSARTDQLRPSAGAGRRRCHRRNGRRSGPRDGRRGFTLVEVLVTLVMVGIILAVAMNGISLALYASGDAKRKLEATSLAETKLAEMTAGLLLQQNTATTGAGDFGPEWPGYRWEATQQNVNGDAELTELQVRVVWRARQQERFVTLSTMAYIGAGTVAPETSAAGGAAPSAATGGGR